MNAATRQLGATALMLAVPAAVYAQEKPSSAPATTPKPSAGLVNDFLRSRNEAFSPWDLGGQFRARYEWRVNGGVAPTTDFRSTGVVNDNSYGLFRTKVHLGYNSECNWFGAYVEGRDAHTVNDRRSPSPDTDTFDLQQAFAFVGNPREFPLVAKVGRQELSYGDERLVGAFDWSNLGRVFDAAKLRYETGALWVDAFAGRVVMPDDGNFNESNDYDWLFGVYSSTRTLLPFQESQLYFLSRNAGVQAASADPGSLVPLPTARDVYTLGIRAKSLPGQLKGWDYTAELAGQLGNIKQSGAAGQRLEQQAFAATVNGGYTFSKVWGEPRVGVEYSFASGDGDPTDDKSGTFEQLFPTNHKFYGYMDFVGWRNIHNPRFQASVKPVKNLSISLDYHLFWLADTSDYFYSVGGTPRNGGGYGINAGFDSFVGSEIDLTAAWNIRPWLNVLGGYGHFFRGDYIKSSLAAVGGSEDADFLYAQAVFNF